MSTTPAMRVSAGAGIRAHTDRLTRDQRSAMTPEEAADDEYVDEARRLTSHTVLARQATGDGLVERPVFGDAEIEPARAEALSSPERLAYIQQRSKEIRTERAAVRAPIVPAASNKPGSHAAVAAVFNAMEEATGREITPEERAELMAWIWARVSVPRPQHATSPRPAR